MLQMYAIPVFRLHLQLPHPELRLCCRLLHCSKGLCCLQEYTNYHFDVAGEALQGALDRFAQFFVDPLCKADALEREVMAVDSEFSGEHLDKQMQCISTQLQQVTFVPEGDAAAAAAIAWLSCCDACKALCRMYLESSTLELL